MAEWSLAQLGEQLRKAPQEIERAAPKVVHKAGLAIVAHAQTMVPVDTGATRASIGMDTDDSGLSATIGPTTWYAPFLEFGTVQMAPRPYMGPAADRMKNTFAKIAAQLGVDVLANGPSGYSTTSPEGTTYTKYGPPTPGPGL